MALLFVGCVQIVSKGRAIEVRGNGELFGAAYLFLGGALAFWLYKLAFKSKPSFSLHDDRIEFYNWKRPVHFRDVDEIVFEAGQIWLKRPPQLALRLKNGSLQYLPYGLMTHGPEAFAELLTAALDRYRTAESDETRSAAELTVTGP